MNRSQTITCSPRWTQHEVTQTLRQRRVSVEISDSLHYCDFVCGPSSVLFYDLSRAEAHRDQALLVTRLAEARHRCGSQPVILMAWVATAEPSLEVLTWLNLECGVAQQCSLLLVWSVDDMVQFLTSLVAAAVTSLEFSGGSKADVSGAPLPVLIDALTQTPQIVTRNDVVRMANRKTSMADVLLSEAADWEGIAGFGHKKAVRLQHLFRTPFLSSQQTVESVVGAGDRNAFASRPTQAPAAGRSNSSGAEVGERAAGVDAPPSSGAGDEATSFGREGMMRALQRRRDEEDADE